MKLMVFKLMYRLTNDRRWLLAYIDEMDKKNINNWRNENEN